MSLSRGRSRSTSRRLCSRAPRMTSVSDTVTQPTGHARQSGERTFAPRGDQAPEHSGDAIGGRRTEPAVARRSPATADRPPAHVGSAVGGRRDRSPHPPRTRYGSQRCSPHGRAPSAGGVAADVGQVRRGATPPWSPPSGTRCRARRVALIATTAAHAVARRTRGRWVSAARATPASAATERQAAASTYRGPALPHPMASGSTRHCRSQRTDRRRRATTTRADAGWRPPHRRTSCTRPTTADGRRPGRTAAGRATRPAPRRPGPAGADAGAPRPTPPRAGGFKAIRVGERAAEGGVVVPEHEGRERRRSRGRCHGEPSPPAPATPRGHGARRRRPAPMG